MLGEVLPPAHIQQVAGELVKALQLSMGEAGGREGGREMASCESGFKAQSRQELLPMGQNPQ